jgi:hypothetical protein
MSPELLTLTISVSAPALVGPSAPLTSLSDVSAILSTPALPISSPAQAQEARPSSSPSFWEGEGEGGVEEGDSVNSAVNTTLS